MEIQLSNDDKKTVEIWCGDYKKYGGKEKAFKLLVKVANNCCSNPDVASAFIEYAKNYMKKMDAV
jgi:hypothetical protein